MKMASVGLVMCMAVGVGPAAVARGPAAGSPPPAVRSPYPGEREFASCSRPAGGGKLDIGSREPEMLELIAWISNMGCRRFVLATAAPLQGRRVGVPSTPRSHVEAYRVFYAALQSLDLGLTVVPAGDSLRITDTVTRLTSKPGAT